MLTLLKQAYSTRLESSKLAKMSATILKLPQNSFVKRIIFWLSVIDCRSAQGENVGEKTKKKCH
jgi:hypothetical protein